MKVGQKEKIFPCVSYSLNLSPCARIQKKMWKNGIKRASSHFSKTFLFSTSGGNGFSLVVCCVLCVLAVWLWRGGEDKKKKMLQVSATSSATWQPFWPKGVHQKIEKRSLIHSSPDCPAWFIASAPTRPGLEFPSSESSPPRGQGFA